MIRKGQVLKALWLAPLLLLAGCIPDASPEMSTTELQDRADPAVVAVLPAGTASDLLNAEVEAYRKTCLPGIGAEGCAANTVQRTRLACAFTPEGVMMTDPKASHPPTLIPAGLAVYTAQEMRTGDLWLLSVSLLSLDRTRICVVFHSGSAWGNDRAAAQARLDRVMTALSALGVKRLN